MSGLRQDQVDTLLRPIRPRRVLKDRDGMSHVAAYLIGLFNGRHDIESRSFWQGFADGELHQQLNDRTPSPN